MSAPSRKPAALVTASLALALTVQGQIVLQPCIVCGNFGTPILLGFRILSPTIPTRTEGDSLSVQFRFVGAPDCGGVGTVNEDYRWSATGLPSSLSIDSVSGVVSGRVDRPGRYSATIRLTPPSCNQVIKAKPGGAPLAAAAEPRTAGNPISTTAAFEVLSKPLQTCSVSQGAVKIAGCPTGLAKVGQQYNFTLSADGGFAGVPYTWGTQSGSLPPGISINGTSMAGVPAAAGTYDYTLAVASQSGCNTRTGALGCSIKVDPANAPGGSSSGGLTILSQCPITPGEPGVNYSFSFQAAGGSPPYTWSLAGGLPPNLTFSPNGTISGIPATSGEFFFNIRVSDSKEANTSKSCSIRLGAAADPLRLLSLEPDTFVTTDRTPVLRARGSGFVSGSKVIWGIDTFGDPPPPIDAQVLNPGELIATIPNRLLADPVNVQITIRAPVQQGRPPVESNPLPLRVVTPPEVSTTCPLPGGSVESDYSQRIAAKGGLPPYTFAVLLGKLPGGLMVVGDEIRGRPAEGGNFNFSLYVSDSKGNNSVKACTLRIPGPIKANPSPVDFEMDADGALPPPEGLSLSSDTPGIALRSSVTPGTGGNWLDVVVPPAAPGLARLSVRNPPRTPGTYTSQVNLQGEGIPATAVPVILKVRPPRPLELTVRPGTLLFTAQRGGRAPLAQTIQVSSTGSGLRFRTSVTYVNGRDWLSLSPADGTASSIAPVNVRVAASQQRLEPNVYSAFINFFPDTGSPVRVGVSFAVTEGPDTIQLSQTGLFFESQSRGRPAVRRFQIAATGDRGFSWDASVETLSGGDWLRLRPASGSVAPGKPAEVEVDVDPSRLDADQYYGFVSVRSDGADNSPRQLGVFLNVVDGAEQLSPAIDPGSLFFVTAPGRGNPAAQSVTVRNLSRSPAAIDFTLEGDAKVFNVASRDARIVAPGGTMTIDVRTDTAGINGGTFRAALNISSSLDNRVRRVDLVLVVAVGATTNASKDGGPRLAGNCNPGQFIVLSRTFPSGFVIPNGWPLSVEATVRDDCADPVNAGGARVTATVQGTANSITLLPLGDGRWTGTLDLVNTAAGSLAIELVAEDLARNLRGSYLLLGTGGANEDTPKVADDGLVSSASFQPGLRLAAGGLFAALGSRLADGVERAREPPFPNRLGNTVVELVGQPARLPLGLAAEQGSFSQVTGQLPFGLTPRIYQVRVRRGSRAALPKDVAIGPEQPGIFVLDDQNQGAVYGTNGAANETNPVAPGEDIVVYTEGLGPVDQEVAIGQAAPGDPPARLRAPVKLTIGGVDAEVGFAGLTPGQVGIYQLNSRMPQGVPAGKVQVVVTVNDIASPAVVMWAR